MPVPDEIFQESIRVENMLAKEALRRGQSERHAIHIDRAIEGMTRSLSAIYFGMLRRAHLRGEIRSGSPEFEILNQHLTDADQQI